MLKSAASPKPGESVKGKLQLIRGESLSAKYTTAWNSFKKEKGNIISVI